MNSYKISRLHFFLTIFVLLAITACVNKNREKKDLPDRLLLKDWEPRSIYNIPKTKIEKAKYPVIDMHAHDYDTLSSVGLEERIRVMDQAGIQKTVVFTNATGARFDSLYERYSKYPDRFMVYCGIDYSGYKQEGWAKKAIKELKRNVKKGAVGVGELHDKGNGLSGAPGMHPDDPRMDPVFDAIAELGIPVNLHMTDPQWMYEPMDSTNDGLIRAWTWRIKNKDEKVGHEGLIKIFANTLEKHQNTTFVAAHLANLTNNLSKLGDLFDQYPNLYADISARFAEFSTIPRTSARFFEKYQDRIVYATDYGWEVFNNNTDYGNHTKPMEMFRTTFRVLETDDDHFYLTDLMGYKWPMYGLGLSNGALKKIYRDNAQKIIASE